MRPTRTGVARAALGVSRVSTHAMGSKKRARHDPDAPMPEMRDQGGLAAVARDVARRAAAVDGGGDEGRVGKKAKKEKKEKKEKKASKEQEKRRDRERLDSKSRRLDGDILAGASDTAPSGVESGDIQQEGEKKSGKKRNLLRRLAGDDAADDAIVREHAAHGNRFLRDTPSRRDEGYGQRVSEKDIAESARRLDAVARDSQNVDFVKTKDVVKALRKSPDLDERLFKAFGAVAARCASLVKKCVQKNASLLGSRTDASKTLAEEMRVDDVSVSSREGASGVFGVNDEKGHATNETARLYGSSKLWNSVKKHNAVVWGRALAACEAAEKTLADEKEKKSKTPTEQKDADDSFASFYRAAVVDAHADDLEELRVSGLKHGDVADVGVLLRAIQSGADVVPALQKALAVQFASLRAFAAEGKHLGDERRGGLPSGSEGDEQTEESEKDSADSDADGDPRVSTKKRSGSKRSGSGGSSSASEEDGSPDDASDDASDEKNSSSSESASAGGDDEVDYAVTPVAH